MHTVKFINTSIWRKALGMSNLVDDGAKDHKGVWIGHFQNIDIYHNRGQAPSIDLKGPTKFVYSKNDPRNPSACPTPSLSITEMGNAITVVVKGRKLLRAHTLYMGSPSGYSGGGAAAVTADTPAIVDNVRMVYKNLSDRQNAY